MNRAEKIRKLVNAVKDYRGSYRPNTGKWIRGPMPSALPRVRHWLQELDQDIPTELARIDAFELIDDMNQWLKSLEQKPTTHTKP